MFDKMVLDEMAHWDTQNSLKELAVKYSHLLEDMDWTKVPPPPVTSRPLSEMTREERNLLHAIYFGYFHGAAQQWRERS
jgi:hypothetical protein